jgi:hypothetical protein
MADAGYESRKLARELKRVVTAHHQTPAARLQVVGLTWIVERTSALAGQKSSLEQRLRDESPNFGSLHRPGVLDVASREEFASLLHPRGHIA